MLVFLLRRIAAGVVLVVVVATATFLLLSLTGTDVARNILGETASPSQVSAKARELGLDEPLVVRYGHWIDRAVHGDLGQSWFTGDSVNQSLANTLPVTLSIVLVGMLIALVLSIALGTVAALRGGWVDRVVQFAAVLGTAIPSFLIALVLAVVMAVQLGLLLLPPDMSPSAHPPRDGSIGHPRRPWHWRSRPRRPRRCRCAGH